MQSDSPYQGYYSVEFRLAIIVEMMATFVQTKIPSYKSRFIKMVSLDDLFGWELHCKTRVEISCLSSAGCTSLRPKMIFSIIFQSSFISYMTHSLSSLGVPLIFSSIICSGVSHHLSSVKPNSYGNDMRVA